MRQLFFLLPLGLLLAAPGPAFSEGERARKPLEPAGITTLGPPPSPEEIGGPFQFLALDSTQFTDRHLARLRKWGRIFLWLNLRGSRVTDQGLKHLQGFSRLQRLDLGGTKVSDEGMRHLKGVAGLERLDLRNTRVTDEGLVYLKKLTRLQRLDLTGTRVTGPGVRGLKESFPELKVTR